MKLIANIQLLPDKEQAKTLLETLERANAACNEASKIGFERFGPKKITRAKLQPVAYPVMRDQFAMTAQAAIHCTRKVADAYKTAKSNGHKLEAPVRFRKHAAQPYDDRIFRILPGVDRVSIWTLAGRLKIPFVCGDRQRELLAHRKGEVDLMFIRGRWYVSCTCEIPDTETAKIEDVLGVDFGVVNIAFDSDGKPYTGRKLKRSAPVLRCAAPCCSARAPRAPSGD